MLGYLHILVGLLASLQVLASVHTDQIIRQSATFRLRQTSPSETAAGDYTRSAAPIAAQNAILEALENASRYEFPVNAFIERQLSAEYSTCSEALGDIMNWCLVLYGDWYGNKASNTLGYYLYALFAEKIPNWVLICNREAVAEI